MATEYKITILKIERDVPYTTEKWQKLVDEPDSKHPEIYGYVKTDITKDIENQIYQQIVEELDLPAVINAANRIQPKE